MKKPKIEHKNRVLSWLPATRRNGDNLNGDNCGPSGDRLSQNGNNESLYLHGLKDLFFGIIT